MVVPREHSIGNACEHSNHDEKPHEPQWQPEDQGEHGEAEKDGTMQGKMPGPTERLPRLG